MINKILNLFSKNKKTLLFTVSLGLILLFVPFYFIEAISIAEWCGCEGVSSLWVGCWMKCVAQAMLSLPFRLAFAIMALSIGSVALVLGILNLIIVALFNWLTGVVMSVGIVPGANNTPGIVSLGWDISRQLANLFFILALAFIGLATTLKIKEYEAKKALPSLIIIALLINFTPVIVGFIVDMGNIVTHFFLRKAGDTPSILGMLKAAFYYIVDSLVIIFSIDGQFFDKIISIMSRFMSILVYGGVLLLFFLVSMFVRSVIILIFFFRIIILWILMILSPIAFLSKVFPDNKYTRMIFPGILHWDKWWESLIQWTIIGIPISFFLYLSNSIVVETRLTDLFRSGELKQHLITVNNELIGVFPDIGDQFVDLFISLLAPTVGLVLLQMGVLISITAAPEGARGILEITKNQGTKLGVAAVRSTARGIRNVPQNIRSTLNTYRLLRTGTATVAPMTRGQATRATASQLWQTRGRPIVASAGRASWSAIKDTSGQIAKKVLDLPDAKKKDRATCSRCGNFIPQGAGYCPHCSLQMPTCSNCNALAVAGTAFCSKCGTRL